MQEKHQSLRTTLYHAAYGEWPISMTWWEKYNAPKSVMQENNQSLRTTSFHTKYGKQLQLNIKLNNQKGNRWMYCSGFVSFHRDEKEDGGDDTTIYDAIKKKYDVNLFKAKNYKIYLKQDTHFIEYK